MKTAIFVTLLGVLEALHCDKEFSFYDDIGNNGFNIICEGLTKEHIYLLENITITNEISLTIANVTLNNVTSKIFHNVPNIRYLQIENSTFTFSRVMPLFDKLTRLEHLAVINTEFFINKNTFVGLHRLKWLILSNNGVNEIEDGSFINLPNLHHLQITENEITNMKMLPLCELQDLRLLNLSRNYISDLSEVHFYCRNSTKTVDFSLNNENYALDIKKRDYFSVSDIFIKLTVLDLSYNNISKIDYVLSDLRNLKVLNLEGNKLVAIKKKEFNSLESIERLNIRNNLLSTIEDKVFSNQNNLVHLDISNNKLTYFKLNDTPLLEYINLAENLLDAVSLNTINATDSLKTLILSNNKIIDILNHTFQKFSTLEVLNLDSNSIKLKDNLFAPLVNLKELSLRNNNIEVLPHLLFKNLTNLIHLDLSFNKIEYFLSNDTFKDLGKIETLNISFNSLRELNYAVLEPLKNLNALDIAGNQLHYIQYDLIISDLPLLSVLNIKANLLSCEQLYKIIKFLKNKNIGYTFNEQFDYEQENVAGIHCSTEKKTVSQSLKNAGMSSESYTLVILGVVVGLILASIAIVVSLFKIHLYLKRRKYRADEFELIDE